MHLAVDDVLAQVNCPNCGSHIQPDDVYDNRLLASCSRCEWRGAAPLPNIEKTIIYLDNSTLSHIASAQLRGDKSSPWLLLYDRLRTAVVQNVVCCPSSPVIDHESELSQRLSRPVREVSRSLSDVRFRYPIEVQELQLIRALRRFLDGEEPQKEFAPPFSDVSNDKPHEWPKYLRFKSLFFATPDQLVQRRDGKTALRQHLEQIFDGYAKSSLSFDEIRRLEAAGVGESFRRGGPPWRFLEIARRHSDAAKAETTVDAFLRSEHAALTPAADITSRLFTLTALSFSARPSRRPKASDAQDVEHIGTYLPYVDILIGDRFFSQRANESIAGLTNYRGRVCPLGQNGIDEFVAMLDDLCRKSTHADLADRVYREIGMHGEMRRFMHRLISAESAARK